MDRGDLQATVYRVANTTEATQHTHKNESEMNTAQRKWTDCDSSRWELGTPVCLMEKEMATHSSVLAWRIPRMDEPGGLPSRGRTESDTTEAT